MTKIFLPLCGMGFLLISLAARADEGMWTFDNFPAASVKAKYGLTVDQAWLDHVRLASVRLSVGCSASVVSGDGLVLTNHHCVRDCAQELSNSTTNYVAGGFQTAKREDEKLCAGMQAEVLAGISDVTSRVTGAVAGKTGQDFVHGARRRNRRGGKGRPAPARKKNSAARS